MAVATAAAKFAASEATAITEAKATVVVVAAMLMAELNLAKAAAELASTLVDRKAVARPLLVPA